MQISTEYLTELRMNVEARRLTALAQLQQIAGTAAILDALIERAKMPDHPAPADGPDLSTASEREGKASATQTVSTLTERNKPTRAKLK